MDESLAFELAQHGIVTRENLADLATDELMEFGIEGLDEENGRGADHGRTLRRSRPDASAQFDAIRLTGSRTSTPMSRKVREYGIDVGRHDQTTGQVLGTPSTSCSRSSTEAGMKFNDPEQVISSTEKVKLLGFLRRTHGKREAPRRHDSARGRSR